MIETFLRLLFVVFLCVMAFTIYKRVRLINTKTPDDQSGKTPSDPNNDRNG